MKVPSSLKSVSGDLPAGGVPLKKWRGERWATTGIWIVILYTIVKNVFAAASKPFWFDELCTVAVARQPNFSAMWQAFGQAEDSSTPLFCLVEHCFARLIPNQEIAYRLPSILAFGCVLWCLFVFVKRRSGATVAFLCAIVPILTPLYRPYAIEARSYGLVVACISIALLCYQCASRWLWFFMGLSLIGAEAFHYYAFFIFFPFGLAEIAFIAKSRTFRWGVWLALLAGFLPVATGWRHLMQLKQFYGTHFWGQASLMAAASVYGSLLRTLPALAIAIVAVLSLVALWMTLCPVFSGAREKSESDDHSHEPMLAFGFLSLPVVEFVVTRIVHGALTDRYALAIALGLAIAIGHLIQLLGRRSAAMVAIFVLVAFSLPEGFFWLSERGHFGRLESPTSSVESLVGSAEHGDLPVVISDAPAYVRLAYYASPEWSSRFVGLADPPAAVANAGSDSIDRQMFALRCCLALQVYDFHTFVTDHPRFLLYSDGAEFDWWPRRLSHDGYSLRLVVAKSIWLIVMAAKLSCSRRPH
jgi:Dolichyl-phosphate-mannose-protein mannosyltransferase